MGGGGMNRWWTAVLGGLHRVAMCFSLQGGKED
jgi:hypothetical protein